MPTVECCSRLLIFSPENLLRSVNRILDRLRGTKKLDLFESARVDPNYPIEDTMRVLSGFVAEGKFDCIGLSECRAETVRRASAVCETVSGEDLFD